MKSGPLRVAFRADASVQIGTGHVMRCLTLADELRRCSAECSFICRLQTGHLKALIEARGFQTHVLKSDDGHSVSTPDDGSYASWLGVAWGVDARETSSVLASAGAPVDWLVVDHYALDARWEQVVQKCCKRTLVIDDLANRPHACEVLLDQNLGSTRQDYSHLLQRPATLLMGPKYALLRPEFPRKRAESLARRSQDDARISRLLITMGGIDRDNATGRVLDLLGDCDLFPGLQITVVMGSGSPSLASVRMQAQRLNQQRDVRVEVLIDVDDMAALMSDSDLAVGAAGSTSWERCCLGLPTIQVPLAANQEKIASALSRAGAALRVDLASLGDALRDTFSEAAVRQQLLESWRDASAITDGRGAERVAGTLMETKQ